MQEKGGIHLFLSKGIDVENQTDQLLGEAAVEFRKVVLQPAIRSLDIRIPEKSWVILDGPDSLGIALFCDLCFGFLEPDSGRVVSRLTSADVNFLGRAPTTYGRTVLEHITCSSRGIDKNDVLGAIGATLSRDLLARLPGDANGLLRFTESIAALELSERDFLEIGEANVLLQKRSAVVIDTTSDFYLQALAQGFRHSQGFLESGKTILWIVDSRIRLRTHDRAWEAHDQIAKINLFFSQEPRTRGMN